MIKNLFKKIWGYFTGGNFGPHRGKRRIATRIIVSMVSRSHRSDIKQYARAALMNISENGICLESQKSFVLDENVYINIVLPSGQQYQVSGTITRVEDLQSTYLYGVNILPIYTDETKSLLHFFRLQ